MFLAQRSIGSLLLGLAVVACQSKPDKPAQKPAAVVRPAPAPRAAPVDVAGAWYRCYRGTLGTPDSVTLHLQAWPNSPENPAATSYYGTYSGADGHPYEVGSLFDGRNPPADSLILAERSPEHTDARQQGAVWRLRQEGDHLIGRRGRQVVRLRRVGPAVGLTMQMRADSIAGLPGEKNSPYAHLSLQVLVPAGGDAATRTTLAAGLLRALRGDTTDARPASTFDALWQQTYTRYRRAYRQDVASFAGNPDTDSTDLPTYALRYDSQTQQQVFWNQGNLLSVGVFSYDYTGGAHGLYSTQALTFDTRTGRALRYADIFRSGSDELLSTLLGQGVRRALKTGSRAQLREFLLVEKMPVTHNVFLTGGGVVFVYQPYEIASFAQGEVRIFLPFRQLRELLQPAVRELVGRVDVAAARREK